jgi:hypothetical protein
MQDAASKVGMELTVLGLGKDFIGHGMKMVLIEEFIGGTRAREYESTRV